MLEAYCDVYSEDDEQNEWFDKIKALTADIGYCADMKQYKEDPSAWRGNVSDVSMFIRVALTGRQNSPDMYAVMKILGKERIVQRLKSAASKL